MPINPNVVIGLNVLGTGLLVMEIWAEECGETEFVNTLRGYRETLDELANPLEEKGKKELWDLYKHLLAFEYLYVSSVNVINQKFQNTERMWEFLDMLSEAKREVRRMLYEHP